MKKKKIKNKFIYLLLGLLIVAITNLINITDDSYAINNDENILVAHFIDVGQGDANFIELPNKKNILIDAGEIEYGTDVTNYIKQLGYDKIDYVIGTHPHTDHIGGLIDVINNFKVDNIYMPKISSNTSTYLNLLKTIKNNNLTITTAKEGLIVVDEDNLKVTILSPTKDYYDNLNDYSIILKIEYNDIALLYMGDASKEVEKDLLYLNDIDVIKIGHHGSKTSSSRDFVNKLSPKYGIIEVGSNNKYNLPNNEIIKRWECVGTKLYRTDINGNIILKTDGKNITIKGEK